MGIVKKQVYKNTIISYIGLIVAYVNTVLLFPFELTNEQYGLYNLFISLSVLYSLFASMGVPGIVSKYFPIYQTYDRRHNGLVQLVAMLSIFGFASLTGLFLIFKPIIISAYINSSPLFVRYYYYLIPLAFFTICFNFFEILSRVIYRSIFSSFLRDILIRGLTTIYLIMIAFRIINFQEFIIYYILSWGLISVLLFINLIFSKKFSLRIHKFKFLVLHKMQIMNYGLFVLVSGAISVLIQKIDVIMLSSIKGDSIQGIYSWYFNIAMIISVPAQALSRTTYQIVADSWQSKNLKNIETVYSKTSIIQMIIGLLLFITILINKDNLLTIVHDKQKEDQFNVIILIGLGFLVDITGGLNTYIISTSRKYRIVTIFVVLSGTLSIILNCVLIPKYGGFGAAVTYLVVMVCLNFCTWLYIKIRFNMQPFTFSHFLAIIIAIICFWVGERFLKFPNVYIDTFTRSGVVALLYFTLCYWLKVSIDLNETVKKSFKRWIA